MIIIKLTNIINFTQYPWLKTLYRKYIKPLKDVKHEKNPLNKIILFEELNLWLIKKPKKNEPNSEIIKLLSINNLKKTAE